MDVDKAGPEGKKADGGEKKAGKEQASAEPPAPMPVPEALATTLELVSRGVSTKEPRLVNRALRIAAGFRKRMTISEARTFADVRVVTPALMTALAAVPKAPEETTDVDMTAADVGSGAKEKDPPAHTPETETFSLLMVIISLVDSKSFESARAVCDALVALSKAEWNRRSLDPLLAKGYFYYGLCYERLGLSSTIRAELLALHRTATLRHDAPGQEVLLNLLLRNYLADGLYDMAEKLRSKVTLPEGGSSQQLCRYLYYLGRIRAVGLEYSEAKDCLQQALSKAPTSGALGFKLAATKWLLVVQLLLGEVPDKTAFIADGMSASLKPYLELAAAVRSGDMVAFNAAASANAASYQSDRTNNLVVRLHRNVVRAGLRRLNLSYSRISLADVASKLGMTSMDSNDIECMVAKAIRDGGIEAKIDHANGWLVAKPHKGVYETPEPQEAFHSRIAFCLNVHNDAVKAMRYPPDMYKKGKKKTEEERERMATEADLASALDEVDDDF